MACSAPIDIPTKKTVNSISGTFNCVYDANMISGETVSLSKNLSHLSIKCSSNNNSKVSFYNAGTYTPSEIRIYKPSLHTYNGAPADAELLIVHSIASSNSKVGSDGLIVSVPITMGGNKRSGLNSIIESANTLSAGTLALNSSAPISSAIDVNEFVPSKPFYVYNGTLPYESCGGNYYYAVFSDPISIATPINNVTPSGIKIAPPPALIQKSKTSPANGMGSTATNHEYALFEFVDTEDCDDPNNGSKNVSQYQVSKANETKALTMNVLWGLLIAIGLWLIYWVFTMHNGNGNVAEAVSDAGRAVSNAGRAVAAAAVAAATATAPPLEDD
jgi:carbonic anhydrase